MASLSPVILLDEDCSYFTDVGTRPKANLKTCLLITQMDMIGLKF